MRPMIGIVASAALATALTLGVTGASQAAPQGGGVHGGGMRGSHFGMSRPHGPRQIARRGNDRHRMDRLGQYGGYGFGYGYGGFGSYGLYDPLGDYDRFGSSGVGADGSQPQPLGPPALLGIRDAAVLPPAIYVLGGRNRHSSDNRAGKEKRVDAGPGSRPSARIITVQ